MNWEERKSIYNKDYFDGELPGHYRDWWWTDFSVWGPRARVVYEAFRPMTALDAGCAKGSLVKFLHGIYGVNAYGFDLSQYAIDTTPYQDIRDRLMVVDLAQERLAFDDRFFDVVMLYDFLEHNDDEHIGNICDEIMRIAKSYILIRSPIINADPELLTAFCKRVADLPFMDKLRLLHSEPYYNEWNPNPDNTEHPNAMPREAIVKLFPPFREIYLDSYFYNIQMGSNPEHQTPVLPFFDTIVLKRKS